MIGKLSKSNYRFYHASCSKMLVGIYMPKWNAHFVGLPVI